MGLLEDKKTAAALIIRKMGKPADSSYESMKHSNEQMKQVPVNEQGDEVDSSMGLQAAVDEMMAAVEMKSPSKFKSALESFLQMWMDDQQYEKED